MTSRTLLLVEDEQSIAGSLIEYLKRERFEVKHCATFDAARSVSLDGISLVLLDWMLPDGDGIDLLRQWRQVGVQIPIIMLTARTDTVDQVVGLEVGADDYVSKPFEPRQLLARIRAHLRRSEQVSAVLHSDGEEVIFAEGIKVDLKGRSVNFAGQNVSLTKLEFELLSLLISNPNKVYSREELLNLVWGFSAFPTTRTVDTHILQLRQKFGVDLFETIRGVGYRFVSPAKN